MMRTTFITVGLVISVLAAACSSAASPDVTKVRDAASVEAGMSLYETSCARCHQSDLGGGSYSGGVAPSLANKTGPSDAALIEIVKRGAGLGMPAFGTQLAEDDIVSIIDYVRSVQALLVEE